MDRRIGVQYYTIRKQIDTLESFDLACKKVSEIGYQIVQISGVKLEAKPMREILDKYGLKAVTSHRSHDDFLNNLDDVIDFNKTLGITLCGVGIMPVDYRGKDEMTTQFIKEIEKISETLKQEGMTFGYHNHSFEFEKINGVTVYERLLKETNPETVKFILDTYWVQLAGKNPAKVIREVGNRAEIVHFKDVKVTGAEWKAPLMGEVGNGNLDWDEIIEACDEAGVQYAIVEQDKHHVDEDPFKALTMSYEFLKTKGFY